MTPCGKQGCGGWAEWRPNVIVLTDSVHLHLIVPIVVCTRHRRSLRTLLLDGAVPSVDALFSQRGVDLRTALFSIQFSAIH